MRRTRDAGRSRIPGPTRIGRGSFLVGALLLAGGPAACGETEPAVARGDRLWADSSHAAALAEYRLALRQRSDDEDVMARVAHGYAVTGQFERAQEIYDRLLRTAPEYADQAVFDYLALAERAYARSDRYGMATAVEAALALRPGLPVEGMVVPLARYYARSGEPERALSYYDRALGAAAADSVPGLLYEIAAVHDALGDCEEAITYLNAFRSRAPNDSRAPQARWQVGDCAFSLARAARRSGELEEALRHLDTVIELGVPENVQELAWFERGEALLAQGNRELALQAYQRVLEMSRNRSGQLYDRARARADELRFGRRWVP